MSLIIQYVSNLCNTFILKQGIKQTESLPYSTTKRYAYFLTIKYINQYPQNVSQI